MNSVNICGNLTRDPELAATAGGTQILKFSVAVNERRKNAATGQWDDYPHFIDCILFGNRAQSLSTWLHKGNKVAISGRLSQSRWEKDGKNYSKLEVVATDVDLMGTGSQKQPQAGYAAPAPQQQAAAETQFYDGDIPF